MLWLLLSVVCSVVIAHLLRLFSHHGGPVLVIFLGNYLFAALFSLVLTGVDTAATRPFDVWLGTGCGVFLLVNFLVYRASIHRNGISLSVGVMRSSLLVPTLVALLAFGEVIGPANYLGIAAVVLAFALMTRGHEPRNLLWLVALFLISGCTDLFYKLYDEWGTGRESLFLFYAFGAAFVVNALLLLRLALRRRWWPSRRDLPWLAAGVALGVPNQLTALFFMYSLRTVPAAIAYPLLAASVVLGGIVVDKLAWKATFTRPQMVTFACILAGIVLLNLR